MKRNKNYKQYLFTTSLVMSSLVVTHIVKAQEVSVSATTQLTDLSDNSANSKKVERVEVIGTRIRKIAKEGTTAVKSVNKEAMKNSANITASDSMRDSSLAIYGVARESSGGSAAATSTIGLRGLGAQRTLVLLNGHRLPNDPSWEAVDLNLIPQSAIERIEVLKDGASALYGSDAIGGVINIVTKKGAAGNEVAAKLTTNNKKGGNVYDVSGVTGFVTNKVDFMMAMNYNHNDKVLGKDRDLTKDGLSSIGQTAAWKGNGQSTWTLANPSECPDDLKVTTSAGTKCYFRYNELASITPEIDQFNLLTDVTYRLDSGIKLYNRNLIVNKDIHWNYAPTPGSLDVSGTGTASNSNAQTVNLRFMEAGNRENHDTEINFNSVVGAKGQLTSDLEYDVSASYGEINRKNRSVSGYLNETVLKQLIANGTYDPLQPQGSRGDLSAAETQAYQNQKSRLFTVEGLVTGEIGEINGESAGMATGVSYLSDKLINNSDDASANGDIIGSAGSSDHGSRFVQSVFSEVSLPVAKKTEVDAALRFDKYSDFGSTLNPKLSAKYQISDVMLLRASVGTGFKAPTLSQLYGSSSSGYATFIDRKMCATDSSYCSASQYLINGGGNSKLKEEKAIAYSLGTVIQPQQNLLISLDSWYTHVKNLVDISYEDLTQAEQNGVDPTKYGVTVNRDNTGEITSIDAKNLNLADEELAGIDLLVDYQPPVSMGSFGLNLTNDFSYMLFDKYEGFPGAGKRNTIGEWGKPQWRNTATAALKSDKSSIALSLRTIPGQNFVNRDVHKKISDLNEIDLNLTHKLDEKSQVAFGVKNLLDAEQPADHGAGTGGATVVNDALYDVNGRKMFVSYSQKF